MSEYYHTNNLTEPISARMKNRVLYNNKAYTENNGGNTSMLKDLNFVEFIHYGMIDHNNNSIIPKEEYLVNVSDGLGGVARVIDFVADAISVMRLNYQAAIDKGLVITEGAAFGNISIANSYTDPRVKYEKYLGQTFDFFNQTYLPNIIGLTKITSHKHYVKEFFDFIFEFRDLPITMTRFNTSTQSSVLDSGLAFSYSDIAFDDDLSKGEQIILHPTFQYFKNLCLNMGFSILHNNPNVLVFDISSPAVEAFRSRLGLYSLDLLFSQRFNQTHVFDLPLLYNNININYNIFVNLYPQTKVLDTICGKTVSNYIVREKIDPNLIIHSDAKQIETYVKLRNIEEGLPFSPQKIKGITKKAKYLLKKLDKDSATGYINREFKDQVWNKDYGYDDLVKKLEGTTRETAQITSPSQISPSTGGSYGSSGGSSGGSGGGGSGY